MDAVKMKKALRSTIRSRLETLSVADIQEKSNVITKHFLALKEYQNASNIGIYLSMPSGEVSTVDIVTDALQKGKRVFVPYLHPNPGISHVNEGNIHMPKRVMNMVSLHSLQDFRGLRPDKWGIPTPDEDTIANRNQVLGEAAGRAPRRPLSEARLDLVVMPGVAFDHDGRRLGHGRGFYDFFLAEYQAAAAAAAAAAVTGSSSDSSQGVVDGNLRPLLVALALPEQLLPAGEIPTEPHDQPIDMVITDRETVHRKA